MTLFLSASVGVTACSPSGFQHAAVQLLQRLTAALAGAAQQGDASTVLQSIAASAAQLPDAWAVHDQQVLVLLTPNCHPYSRRSHDLVALLSAQPASTRRSSNTDILALRLNTG